MRQCNDAVLIRLSLVVKADDVDASVRVKGEDTISSYLTSSWWVWRDEALSKPAFVSFTLAIGWHLLAKQYTFISVRNGVKGIVQALLVDLSDWSQRINSYCVIYFLPHTFLHPFHFVGQVRNTICHYVWTWLCFYCWYFIHWICQVVISHTKGRCALVMHRHEVTIEPGLSIFLDAPA